MPGAQGAYKLFLEIKVNLVNIFSPLKNKTKCSSKFVAISAWEILKLLETPRFNFQADCVYPLQAFFGEEVSLFLCPEGEEGVLPVSIASQLQYLFLGVFFSIA